MKIFNSYYILLTCLTRSKLIKTENDDESNVKPVKKSCVVMNRLIRFDKTDEYKLVEVGLNQTAILNCHYW